MSGRTGKERKSASDIGRERALMRDVLPAVLALLVAEALVVRFAGSPGVADGGPSTRWLILPLIPAAWLVVAQVRSLRRADEFQRIQQLTALAVGFATTLMLSLAGSLLVAGNQAGNQAQWLQITFIGGVLSWLVALAVVTRRAI